MSYAVNDTIAAIEATIEKAAASYHRLAIIVQSVTASPASALRATASRRGIEVVNLNLALAERLAPLSTAERARRVEGLLSDVLKSAGSDPVFLDHVEILFDRALMIDPLRLLTSLSRSMTIIVSWRGTLDGDTLSYARPDHPEGRSWRHIQSPAIAF